MREHLMASTSYISLPDEFSEDVRKNKVKVVSPKEGVSAPTTMTCASDDIRTVQSSAYAFVKDSSAEDDRTITVKVVSPEKGIFGPTDMTSVSTSKYAFDPWHDEPPLGTEGVTNALSEDSDFPEFPEELAFKCSNWGAIVSENDDTPTKGNITTDIEGKGDIAKGSFAQFSEDHVDVVAIARKEFAQFSEDDDVVAIARKEFAQFSEDDVDVVAVARKEELFNDFQTDSEMDSFDFSEWGSRCEENTCKDEIFKDDSCEEDKSSDDSERVAIPANNNEFPNLLMSDDDVVRAQIIKDPKEIADITSGNAHDTCPSQYGRTSPIRPINLLQKIVPSKGVEQHEKRVENLKVVPFQIGAYPAVDSLGKEEESDKDNYRIEIDDDNCQIEVSAKPHEKSCQEEMTFKLEEETKEVGKSPQLSALFVSDKEESSKNPEGDKKEAKAPFLITSAISTRGKIQQLESDKFVNDFGSPNDKTENRVHSRAAHLTPPPWKLRDQQQDKETLNRETQNKENQLPSSSSAPAEQEVKLKKNNPKKGVFQVLFQNKLANADKQKPRLLNRPPIASITKSSTEPSRQIQTLAIKASSDHNSQVESDFTIISETTRKQANGKKLLQAINIELELDIKWNEQCFLCLGSMDMDTTPRSQVHSSIRRVLSTALVPLSKMGPSPSPPESPAIVAPQTVLGKVVIITDRSSENTKDGDDGQGHEVVRRPTPIPTALDEDESFYSISTSSLCTSSSTATGPIAYKKVGHMRRASRIRRSSLPVDVDEVRVVDAFRNVKTLQDTAVNHIKNEEYEQALELLTEILIAFQEKFHKNHPLVGAAMHNVGLVHLFLEQYDQSLEHFTKATFIRKISLGNISPDHLLSIFLSALVHYALGNHTSAQNTLRDVTKLTLEKDGHLISHQTAATLNNLGCIQYASSNSDLPTAMRSFRKSLDIHEELLKGVMYDGDYSNTGVSTFSVARRQKERVQRIVLNISMTKCNVGFLCMIKKDTSNAVSVLEDCLRTQMLSVDEIHPLIMITMENLAHANLVRGAYERSSNMYGWLLSAQIKRYGPYHIQTAKTTFKIGSIHLEQKNYRSSIDYIKKVFECKDRNNDPSTDSSFGKLEVSGKLLMKKLGVALLALENREKAGDAEDALVVTTMASF